MDCRGCRSDPASCRLAHGEGEVSGKLPSMLHRNFCLKTPSLDGRGCWPCAWSGGRLYFKRTLTPQTAKNRAPSLPLTLCQLNPIIRISFHQENGGTEGLSHLLEVTQLEVTEQDPAQSAEGSPLP